MNSKKNSQEKQQGVDLCHRIWEGAVGICLRPQEKKDGTYFWKYTFIRCYKQAGDEKMLYDPYFSRLNDGALASVISQAYHFMDNTDPERFVADVFEKYLESSSSETKLAA